MNLTQIEKYAVAVLLGIALAAAVAVGLLGLTGCRMAGTPRLTVKGNNNLVFIETGETTQAADKELLRGAKADVSPR